MRVAILTCLLAACRFHFDDLDDAGPIQHQWARAASGGEGTCGLTTSGEVWCWGNNGNGNLGPGNALTLPVTRAVDATEWKQIGVGVLASCGLNAIGEVWCWGRNERGAIPGAPPDARTAPIRVTTNLYGSLAVADKHVCAITASNELWCWGDNELAQLGNGRSEVMSPPAPVVAVGTAQWTAVATNNVTTCGIQTDGSLWCWGYNNLGQVGDASLTMRTNPVQIEPTRTWTAVAPGRDHTCAIEQGGQVWCWGSNGVQQLGDPGAPNRSTPGHAIAVPLLVSLRAGRSHTCGVDAAGAAWCWGLGEHGQLGATIATTSAPIMIAPHPADVATGGDVTCFVDDAAVLRCTGANDFGQVTTPTGLERMPARADSRTDWKRIFAAMGHACGLTTADELYCWGANLNGELGIGNFIDQQVPRDTAKQFVDVTIGTTTIGTRAADGSYWLAGIHFDLNTYSTTATQYAPPGEIKTMAVGENHGCYILNSDELECGGANFYGQLGNGSTTATPAVNIGGAWRLVAAHLHSTCAVTTADQLFCWGYNNAGQLGIGSTMEQSTPQPVDLSAATGTVTQVVLGFSGGSALTSTGEIWNWGEGSAGQLGNGIPSASLTPQRMGTDTDWRFIARGDSHVCAIKLDNSLWCWGHADLGQVSEPLVNARTTPTKIGANEWTDVAPAGHYTCALKLDGSRWCFGNNSNGQLGDGKSWVEQFTVIP